MPDREFIHSFADVTSTLFFALDSGMQVRLDEPQEEPIPRLVTRDEVPNIKRGVLFLYRPEWVFGPFQTMPISGGHNIGKYFVSPNVNCSAITVYFQGERKEHGHRKLGSSFVSWDRDWLEMPAKVIKPTPPEVEACYKRLVAHLSSKLVIKAGVHRYHVSRSVFADPNAHQCLPPFDYIPWGSEAFGNSEGAAVRTGKRQHSN